MSATTAPSPAPGRSKSVKHPVDEVLPPQKLFIYGFQHVLAFYAGAVIVPIILASAIGLNETQLIHLINADLFTCGIASIIQSVGFWKVGVRLPLLQGVTFTAVAPMIAIGLSAGGGTDGLREIYGSVIVAGIATFFAAPYFGKLLRFFPPVVTGTLILIIGLTLLPVAINDAVRGGFQTGVPVGKNLAYAMFTLAIIVIIQRVFKGFMATIAVLAGLVIGTTVAVILGDANFDSVKDAHSVGVTTPFYFGIPTFGLTAIISMLIVMMITAVETTGDVFATGEIVEKKVGQEDVSRALRADGLATTIGGVLNSFPYTCFAENVGLVRLTAVKSRWVVATAGAIMIVLGVIPKAGAIAASIPVSVLGGAALAMFATVAVVGIQVLSKVDFNDHRNVVIVSTSVGVAMLITFMSRPGTGKYAIPAFGSEGDPDERLFKVIFGGGRWVEVFFNSGITVGAITVIALNLIFFHIGKSFGPGVAGTPGGGVIRLDQVNEMSKEEFAATFVAVFQGSDWAVNAAYAQRPFNDTHSLREALQDALFAGSPEQQDQLLSTFPDLGAEQLERSESQRDQSVLGLDRLNDEDYAEFDELNREYRAKYGFPLIMAVRDLDKRHDVIEKGWERMEHSVNQERAMALIEIGKIVNHRFNDLVAEANPIHTARTQRFDQLGGH